MRFLTLSLLAHLLLLAPIYFLLRPAPEEDTGLQLSKGEIFVGGNPNAETMPENTSAPSPSPLNANSEPPTGSALGSLPANGQPQTANGTSEAHLAHAITIAYPALSARLGEAGKVSVTLEVSETGQASNAKVVRSSGFYRLDQAALAGLADALYAPANRNGAPVPSQKEITVDFRLQPSGSPGSVEIAP